MKATDEQIRAAYEAAGGNFRVGAAAIGMTKQGFGMRCHKLCLSPTGKRRDPPAASPASETTPDVPVAPTPSECDCGAWLPAFASTCHRCKRSGPGAYLSKRLLSFGQPSRSFGEERSSADKMVDNMSLYWRRKAAA